MDKVGIIAPKSVGRTAPVMMCALGPLRAVTATYTMVRHRLDRGEAGTFSFNVREFGRRNNT